MKYILFLVFFAFTTKCFAFADCSSNDSVYKNVITANTFVTLYSWVAEKLNVTADFSKAPKVIYSECVEKSKYLTICPYCKNIRISFYSIKTNEILIRDESDLSSIVHEIVHHFQVVYFNNSEDPSGFLEDQAINIQTIFKNEFFNSQ